MLKVPKIKYAAMSGKLIAGYFEIYGIPCRSINAGVMNTNVPQKNPMSQIRMEYRRAFPGLYGLYDIDGYFPPRLYKYFNFTLHRSFLKP